jgi:hypothetical protein
MTKPHHTAAALQAADNQHGHDGLRRRQAIPLAIGSVAGSPGPSTSKRLASVLVWILSTVVCLLAASLVQSGWRSVCGAVVLILALVAQLRQRQRRVGPAPCPPQHAARTRSESCRTPGRDGIWKPSNHQVRGERP